jgi:hypothetical protein
MHDAPSVGVKELLVLSFRSKFILITLAKMKTENYLYLIL